MAWNSIAWDVVAPKILYVLVLINLIVSGLIIYKHYSVPKVEERKLIKKPLYFILAENATMAYNWARNNRVSYSDIRYVDRPEHVQGATIEKLVILRGYKPELLQLIRKDRIKEIIHGNTQSRNIKTTSERSSKRSDSSLKM